MGACGEIFGFEFSFVVGSGEGLLNADVVAADAFTVDIGAGNGIAFDVADQTFQYGGREEGYVDVSSAHIFLDVLNVNQTGRMAFGGDDECVVADFKIVERKLSCIAANGCAL